MIAFVSTSYGCLFHIHSAARVKKSNAQVPFKSLPSLLKAMSLDFYSSSVERDCVNSPNQGPYDFILFYDITTQSRTLQGIISADVIYGPIHPDHMFILLLS